MCLWGDTDIYFARLINITLTTPAPGMQIVMDCPHSGCPVAFSNLLHQTFAVTRDMDPNDI